MADAEVVADASVLVDALTAVGSPAALRLAGTAVHGPHLVDIEVANALRSMAVRGTLNSTEAAGARAGLLVMVQRRYGHELLLERIWELRDNVRTYDAAYVALAETLDLPLVTSDQRLARAPGLRCQVETV